MVNSVERLEENTKLSHCVKMVKKIIIWGPVAQSIVSLTSLFRGQLVKCFTTLLARLDEVQEELLYYPGIGGGGVSKMLKKFCVKSFFM